jgi:hypothetical protein
MAQPQPKNLQATELSVVSAIEAFGTRLQHAIYAESKAFDKGPLQEVSCDISLSKYYEALL